MTTPPDDVRSRPVLASAPQAWAGPSFLWSAPMDGLWQVVVGGWRWRSIEWERRFDDAGLVDQGVVDTPWGWSGQQFTAPAAPEEEMAGAAVELEVVLDHFPSNRGYLAGQGVREAVQAALGQAAVAELAALPAPGAVSITRNRPLLGQTDIGLRVADLRFSTLPYRHGDARRPIQFASRWLRLAATDSALLALWAPLEGHWQPEHIRWPHHAVPSRRIASLRTAAGRAGVDARLACLLADCLEHERYYLDTWQMELETWEATIYGSLAAGEAVLKGIDLSDPVREQAGALAVFLSRTQLDLRALKRRADVEPLFAGGPVQEVLQPGLAEAVGIQSVNQRLRREAFSLLTSVAAGEQLQAARDQADSAYAQSKATEGLQQTITWITALLLAPTVVIGVFGANITELAAGTGNLVQLGQWMLLAAGLSMTVLWRRNPPVNRHRWLPTAAGLLVLAAVAGGLALWRDGRTGQGLLWSAAAGSWAAAMLTANLTPRPVRPLRRAIYLTRRRRRQTGDNTAWT